MSSLLTAGAVLAAVVAGVGSAEAAPVLQHQPLTCVVAGTYPWIVARSSDPERVVGVKALFRAAGSGPWYSVHLASRGDTWEGALPRPAPQSTGFVYRLEATDTTAATSATADAGVRIAADERACGGSAGPSVAEAQVTVHDAAGVPVTAGPEGFVPATTPDVAGTAAVDPADGSGKVGVFDMSPRTSLIAGLGVAAAAVGGALAVAGDDTPAPSTVEVLSTVPASGSTISLAAPGLSVRLRIVPGEDVPAGSVRLSLNDLGGQSGVGIAPRPCVSLVSPHAGLTAGRVAEVALDRVESVTCAAPFVVGNPVVEVRGPGQGVRFTYTLGGSLHFFFEP